VRVAEVGARMRQGEVLAKLDDAALRLRLDEARAEQARAVAQRNLAQTQLDRLTRLAPGNAAVAQSQMDEAKAQHESMRQDLSRLEARTRAIEHEIAETEIRAPYAGIVSERYVQRGEYVALGAAVVHLVDTEHLEARVQAPLSLAPNLRAGTVIAVRSGGNEQRATVRAVVPVGDERSRQFELRLALPEGLALVGTPIEAALPESQASDSLAVPRDALVLRQDRTYVVRVKDDNTAERVEVTPGLAQDTLVAVRGALAAGDRIVVRGAERLESGQAVKIIAGPRQG
jgi:RND family efflux transporter MFP subunit